MKTHKIIYPKVKFHRKRKLFPSDIEEMKKMRKDGATLEQVAKKFNVHVSTVYYKTSGSKKYEKFKERMRKRNNENYANDPEFRQKLKQQVMKYQKKRAEEDGAFRRYKLDLTNHYNKEKRKRDKAERLKIMEQGIRDENI